MRKFAWLLPVCAILVTLLTVVRPATVAAAPFSFNWDGTPAAPQSVVPANWDVQIHRRDTGDDMEPMDAQHGPACEAPPATHPISQLKDGVYLCKNHLMTAIGDGGYGEIALTSDHMVDFSNGTTAVKVSVSTQQFNSSDFIEVWISPFAENLTLPFQCCDPDLQGPPKDALRFSLNVSGVEGTYEGDVTRYVNYVESRLSKARTDRLTTILAPSAATRTTYEIDLSSGHIRFGLPNNNVWWTDVDTSTLPFTVGVVQLTHHSYNPLKHDPGTGVDTWHWSDFSISNAVPFTIINGAERSIHATGATTVHFPTPAPANSFLRFSGIGPQKTTYKVSYDGGKSWVSPASQLQQGTHEEHFSSYWSSIPAGVQTVTFSGQDWWGGVWWVRDPSIWSLAPGSTPAASPSASPSAAPSASSNPRPTPSSAPPPPPPPPPAGPPLPGGVAMNNAPCMILLNGSEVSGTCQGAFVPNPNPTPIASPVPPQPPFPIKDVPCMWSLNGQQAIGTCTGFFQPGNTMKAHRRSEE